MLDLLNSAINSLILFVWDLNFYEESQEVILDSWPPYQFLIVVHGIIYRSRRGLGKDRPSYLNACLHLFVLINWVMMLNIGFQSLMLPLICLKTIIYYFHLHSLCSFYVNDSSHPHFCPPGSFSRLRRHVDIM